MACQKALEHDFRISILLPADYRYARGRGRVESKYLYIYGDAFAFDDMPRARRGHYQLLQSGEGARKLDAYARQLAGNRACQRLDNVYDDIIQAQRTGH